MFKPLLKTILFAALLIGSVQISYAQQVSSFTLVNATTDTEVGPLSDGDVINLNDFGGDALNVIAYTIPETVGSVVFTLQGTTVQTESFPPYAMAGNQDDDYLDWRPSPGGYQLKATPYAQAGGKGEAGTPLSISFTVVEESTPSTPPAAPSALEATVNQPGVAVLSWQDNATNENAFKIEAADGFNVSAWQTLATVPANTTTYTDNTLDEEGYRSYRVSAVNEAGTSTTTPALEVTNVPYPPTDFIISQLTETSFLLQWTPAPFGNDYLTEYALSENGDYQYFDALYYGYDEITYDRLEPGTTYYFRMRTNFQEKSSEWNYFSVKTLGGNEAEAPAVVRINAGGEAVSYGEASFIADAYFDGKTIAYTNQRVSEIASTEQDALYLSERTGERNLVPFSYNIPLTNGEYTIRLHFAEIYWGATGGGPGGPNQRVFDVSLEGTPVLTNFDINQEVGSMTATIKTFTVQVDDQELNLDFSADINRPKLSAIEVLGEGSLLDEEPPAEELPAVVRINAGGAALSYGEANFTADAYFAGNGKSYTNPQVSEIANTEQDALYLTERSTNQSRQSFGYNIPLTNGEYTIKLHFAEIYWGATGGGPGGANQRVFDVSLEGTPVLTNFDINQEVGSMTATVKTFTVQVDDQELNLNFSASVDQPKVSAIEIFGKGSILPQDPTSCGWNALASSSISKLESQSAKVNGKLYTFAGFMSNLKITGVTEVYDPATDSWSTGAPMPTPVTHMGAAVIGNDIWIVAGFVGDHPGTATDKVQIYNTLTDTWRSGPALPNPRGSGAAAYANGKLHFFGGLLPDRVTDVGEHYVLEISNQAAGWQAAAPMPNPRNHLSAAAVDGKIYAIGGQHGHDNGVQDQSFLHVYDPQTDTWSRKADLPSARSHFEPGTIVHNDKIIIVGGRRGNFFFDDVTEYDPATDTWSERCELPENLLAPAAKVFGDRLIVANGGINGTCCPIKTTRWLPIEPEVASSSLARTASPEDKPTASVNAYPNPAQQQLTVALDDASVSNPYTLKLVSRDGITYISATADQAETQLEVSGLPGGIYALVIQGQQGTQKKLIMINQ